MTVEGAAVPHRWPDGSFDLIVVSEVGYYFDADRLDRGEDRALVAALRGNGTTVAYTTAAHVTTSARVAGRAVGGFADTLTARALEAECSA